MSVYDDTGCIGCGLVADNCVCEDGDRWACAFPGRCLMPAEHLRDECHTVESYREFEKDARREGLL